MKFISWNVNGLRACVNKGFKDFFDDINADFFCLQETKLQQDRLISHPRDIIPIGTMPKRRGIAALRFLQNISRLMLPTVWVFPSTIKRADL